MIRRLTKADVKKVRPWLHKLYQDDPETGGDADTLMSEDRMKQLAQENAELWVCVEGGKPIGVLYSPGASKDVVLETGETVSVNLFNLLAVDYQLYQVSPQDTARIAGELTLFAANDLTAHSRAQEYIYVIGPTKSRGASWCRDYLKMKECRRGNQSHFWMLFKDIWARLENL